MPSGFRGFLLLLLTSLAAWAQSSVPTLSQSLPDKTLAVVDATTVDLRNYFTIPGVTGQVAQFDTVMGRFNVELLADAAPKHVANFIAYANAGAYANSFFHRAASLDGGATPSIVQGGGYLAAIPPTTIPKNAPVPLEYNLPNARGTLAAARVSDPNSATSEWFFNVRDQSTLLGPQNDGYGYTVFGRVVGTGMSVIEAIAQLPLYNLGTGTAFVSTPLRNVQSGQTQVQLQNFVTVTGVKLVPLFPDSAGAAAVVTFSATSDRPDIATASLSGSSLTITLVALGSARVTVTATDTNGNAASGVFDVTAGTGTAPTITVQPQSVTASAGSMVALTVAASGLPAPSYQWSKNGVPIAGATNATLQFRPVTATDAASYTVRAVNGSGSATSAAATVTVAAGGALSRLASLSVRANAVIDPPLIVGFYANGTKSVLVRAVGPSLANYGLPTGYYPDPLLDLVNQTTGASVGTNDNWDASLKPTMDRLYAFELIAGSKDAALLASASGLYSAVLKGVGGGVALVEVYDADASATSTRLTSVSARNFAGTGANVLIAGFSIAGPVAKTVLIRGVGPKLTGYGVANALADPKLEVYLLGGAKVAENDNWNASLAPVFTSVYAFALDVGSKDAALLVTLPPGLYTAQVSGADGGSGTALVEVYDLDP